MATRYCGTLKLTITLKPDDSYSVRIIEVNDDARFEPLTGLNLAPYMATQIALDSAAAYSAIAVAAISFAGNGDDAIYNFARCDESGDAIITRKLGA